MTVKPPPQQQPFYGPFSRTIWVSRCQKRTSGLYMVQGKINRLIIRLGATPSGLTSPLLHHPPIFYRPDTLPAAQPTVSKHWRPDCKTYNINWGLHYNELFVLLVTCTLVGIEWRTASEWSMSFSRLYETFSLSSHTHSGHFLFDCEWQLVLNLYCLDAIH